MIYAWIYARAYVLIDWGFVWKEFTTHWTEGKMQYFLRTFRDVLILPQKYQISREILHLTPGTRLKETFDQVRLKCSDLGDGQLKWVYRTKRWRAIRFIIRRIRFRNLKISSTKKLLTQSVFKCMLKIFRLWDHKFVDIVWYVQVVGSQLDVLYTLNEVFMIFRLNLVVPFMVRLLSYSSITKL